MLLGRHNLSVLWFNTTCQISPKCNGGCLSSLHTLMLTGRAIMMPIVKWESIELIYNWYGTLMNSKVIHESERAGGRGGAPRRRLRRAKACKSWCEMVHISWEIQLSGNSQKKNSQGRHIQNTQNTQQLNFQWYENHPVTPRFSWPSPSEFSTESTSHATCPLRFMYDLRVHLCTILIVNQLCAVSL